MVLCFYQKKSWWSLRRLKDISWRRSWARLLEKALGTSPGRRFKEVSCLDDVLEKVVATSISDQSKTSLRPKLRRSYDVFATSLCRLGCFPITFMLPLFTTTQNCITHITLSCLISKKLSIISLYYILIKRTIRIYKIFVTKMYACLLKMSIILV